MTAALGAQLTVAAPATTPTAAPTAASAGDPDGAAAFAGALQTAVRAQRDPGARPDDQPGTPEDDAGAAATAPPVGAPPWFLLAVQPVVPAVAVAVP
ncbi:hypothetical protein, partial [Klenkia sp. PcliD-1-E]|uniref:hypothetical protein n=1 Tax=Klenkia sp. PcliD-1-E TaxID=2954492 RepID=UPI00209778FF